MINKLIKCTLVYNNYCTGCSIINVATNSGSPSYFAQGLPSAYSGGVQTGHILKFNIL